MKPALACLLLSIFSLASAHAQQKSVPAVTPKLSDAYIDVFGARLRLGMAKADVAEKTVGNETLYKTDDEWTFKDGTIIQFTNGRLSFVSRDWGDTPVESLFGLVNSFNSEGYRFCDINADTLSSPDSSSQRVWINCGNKAILVIKIKIGDKYVEGVQEHLGSLEIRPK